MPQTTLIVLASFSLVLAFVSLGLSLWSLRIGRILRLVRKEDALLSQLGPKGYLDLYHTDFLIKDFGELTWWEKQQRIWYCWWDENTNWLLGNINYDALTGRTRWYSRNRRLK